MAKHVANCQQTFLQEENQRLSLQLKELKAGASTSSKVVMQEQPSTKEVPSSLEETIVQLQEEQQQAKIAMQALKEQLQQKETQLACMASWAIEAIQCRAPARSYGLFLRDQWLQFQINTLAQRGMLIQSPHQFFELCSTSSAEDRAKLAEFYLHNLALPNEVSWDPNIALGDMQLMALASWLNHEDQRANEAKSVMNREVKEPLLIRPEIEDPVTLISTHKQLATDPTASLRWMDKQAQAIAHFEDMERLLGDNAAHACQRRWNTLGHSLQVQEYHTPIRMREALARVARYKKSVQSLQANWIGLKLSPPLLLGLTEGNSKENDGQQWAEVDRTAGFHTRREDTTTEPWDASEAVRAMKDEDLD